MTAAVLVAALVGAGCAAEGTENTPPTNEACREVERPTVQDGGHLLGDQEPPVPYSSTPASSGWHAGGAPPVGVHDEPLDDPDIVAVLHVGGVVAAYDPDAVPAEDVSILEDLAGGPEDLTVTPYDGDLEAPLALVAWGTVQRCDEVDADAVTAFIDTYADPLDPH